MATVLKGVLPKISVLLCVFFLWVKGLNAKDIHKEIFLSTLGIVCRVKRFITGSRNAEKRSADDEAVETEMGKRLRQK
jgi:hypothetical protein